MNHEFANPFSYKVIYIFAVDDRAHEGLLKIGETTLKCVGAPQQSDLDRAAYERIKDYTNTVAVDYDLLYTRLAVADDHSTFRDHDVHNVLKRSGYAPHAFKKHSAREWFAINLETAVAAINAVVHGRRNLTGITIDQPIDPIIFRPEQLNAIKMAVKYFDKRKPENILWNAKMRFGKTLCALEVVKRCAFVRTIIVTHQPVVNAGWFDDFKKIFAGTDYRFGSKTRGETINELIDCGAPFIWFASMQDLRGSELVGGNFSKHSDLFNVDWQLLIVDEAHEGTQTERGEKVFDALVKPATHQLNLSGTPFNLTDDFDSARTFNWTYVDEQRAKKNFSLEHPTDHNPYADLPRLNIRTYDLNRLLGGSFIDIEDRAFNFAEFFRVDHGQFVHLDAVSKFIDMLGQADGYPFSTKTYRDMFRHTLWLVPGVDEAKALCDLLNRHWVFENFKIINVAGDEGSNNALDNVKNAIKANARTITVSCRRLTTGVTVPEWTAVFMLAGNANTSAISYMQTIFRVQSPCSSGGLVKTDCFVFDFAPDRTLKVFADAVALNNPSAVDHKQLLGEFLNFAPVIAFDGSRMVEYDVDHFFRQLKRAQVEHVFRKGFDSPLLFKPFLLADVDHAAFNRLSKIFSPKKDSSSKDIPVNAQGFDDVKKTSSTKKNSSASDEKKERVRLIGLLRAVAIRLPLMIYGADLDDDAAISIDGLISMIDDRSWTEFMPKGLTKELFARFISYFDEDIFAAAARRIRDCVRRADLLAPVDRVEEIAKLFSTFKNPDKETVLTPWRVVKQHIDLTLNADGADFDFKLSRTVLEINSKTGLYPLYAAYLFLMRRFATVDADTQAEMWDLIIERNIYALCRTPMAEAITRRTLMGFGDVERANVACVEDIVERLRATDGADDFALEICSRSFWREGMGTFKFDAVVGNPPYQENAVGGTDKPVYHHFIEAAQKLSDRATLIHPARFLFNAGATPSDWNKKFLADPHWKVVKYEANAKNFFPDSEIKGGIAITYYDANKTFETTDIFIPFDELRSIHQKVVVDNPNFQPLSSIIYSATIHRLTKKFHEENPWAIDRLTKGHETYVSTNIFDRLPEIFTLKKPDDDREYIEVYGLSRTKRVYRYVRRDYIAEHETIDKYKVFVPNANSAGAIGETLSSPLVGSPLVGSPLVITTQTFITLGSFDSISEANAAYKYVLTKFCRVMLGILKVTQHNPPETWSKVPLQDFTAGSDIDWSLSVPAIDRQLYEKYGLSADEIAFIESKVRAMD
ncbi:MAG: Eco57I restriction-modification methylase domain-containing protein [Selenomonadaceae bacterium]|nr:Eco57I restriction-modification methylase domain-containing protein [Selenomonadaceae bacterium]